MTHKGSGIFLEGRERQRLVRLAVLLVVLIGVMIALSDLATRLKEKIEFDYVRHQSSLLQNDPAQVVAFVNQRIQDAAHEGSLLGPVATLWSGSGSELDRAQLLMEMLIDCGEQAQLARSGKRWWVESPALPPPAGVGTAQWRGSLIPPSDCHRLEVEIRTNSDQEPLCLLWNLADINNDPILMDWTAGSIHVRRASRSTPMASIPLPAEGQSLQVLCRHLRPDDSVVFEGTKTLPLSYLQMMSSQEDGEETSFEVGVLVVMLATPPQDERIHPSQLSGRILPRHASFAYQNVVDMRRAQETDGGMMATNPADPIGAEIPYLYLATIPPRMDWMTNAAAIRVEAYE
ncbi:MAG: hypothetical protein QF489_06945 [Planctomycetota bacterium]|jgi:hypothetical protein|nr:hypothetical protein [Planctomycetota bacterium]